MALWRLLTLPVVLAVAAGTAHGAPITVVSAENVYGGIAAQIGGDEVAVTSILSSPDQDPHLFEASPSTAKALAEARVIIMNGADYDPWMKKLIPSGKPESRLVIDVAELVGRKPGDNPHLWYDLDAVRTFAAKFEQILAAEDPVHETDYSKRLAAFGAELEGISKKVRSMRERYAGVPVTATEPVFGYMAEAIGLDMRNGTTYGQWMLAELQALDAALGSAYR